MDIRINQNADGSLKDHSIKICDPLIGGSVWTIHPCWNSILVIVDYGKNGNLSRGKFQVDIDTYPDFDLLKDSRKRD